VAAPVRLLTTLSTARFDGRTIRVDKASDKSSARPGGPGFGGRGGYNASGGQDAGGYASGGYRKTFLL
jgi:hypothetical protein